jgi:hypothetical protein
MPRRLMHRFRSLMLLALLVPAACSDGGMGTGGGEEGVAPFRAAATCGGCHPQHFAEWKASMHAFGGVDPVMLASAEKARAEAGDEEAGKCFACHAPALERQELYLANLGPDADPILEDLSEDGVSCDVCHSIDIVPPLGSIDFLQDVDPRGPKLAGIENPVANSFHESRADASFRTSAQCRSCHQVFLDDGTAVESTFQEWEDSILSGQGIECQDCHMTPYEGQAAIGGPQRTLHRHTFVGADYLTEPFRGVDVEAQKDDVRTLLANSVGVTAEVPASVAAGDTLHLRFPVTNDRTGHAIPSGTSFAREMWMSVEVRDAADALLYRSGWLEANDDLTEADPDLVSFGSDLRDADGERTVFLWQAVSIDESRLLQYGDTRVAEYALEVPPGTPGPISVDVALRFRPFPPSRMRELDLDHLLPVEIFEMWSGSYAVPVP